MQKKAIQLKEEGNAFFKEKNVDAAIAMYTGAGLYAHRAACNWALKRYVDLFCPMNTDPFHDEGIKSHQRY